MQKKVLTPTETVADLIRQGIPLLRALAIVRQQAQELNVRCDLPSTDEVLEFVGHYERALLHASTKTDPRSVRGPLRIDREPQLQLSSVATIARAVIASRATN
jgi:hypothetical protein